MRFRLKTVQWVIPGLVFGLSGLLTGSCPALACEMIGGFALCAPQTNALTSARGARDDALVMFNQFDTSNAQRLITTSLKLSLRGDEEWGGGFMMAKRGLITTPHQGRDSLAATPAAHQDRNTLNAFTVGWEMVKADSYYAVAIGRQWSIRTNQANTVLFERIQTATLAGTMIERWRNGLVLSVQMDVDTILRGVTYKSSVMLPLTKEIMIGPEITVYRDRSFQRQRLGAAFGGLIMLGNEYHLALGYEKDSLAHRGLYTAIMAARRF